MGRISTTWRHGLVVVLVGALCAAVSAALYSVSGKSRIHEQPARVSDGVNIILGLTEIDAAHRMIGLRAELVPTGSYLNDAKDAFAVPIRMTVKNVVRGPVTTEIQAGQAVGKDYQLTFPLVGDPEEYPFDRYDYHYEYSYNIDAPDFVSAPLIRVERTDGDGVAPVPIGLLSGPKDGQEGWTEHWNLVAEGSVLKARITLERSGGLLAFVAIVLLLLIALSNLAILVAWSAISGRRPVEVTFAGWMAVLLFAIIPLRINLPGAPPIGAWIDAVAFYWIEIAVLISMVVFVSAWFRFRDVPDYTALHEARAKRR